MIYWVNNEGQFMMGFGYVWIYLCGNLGVLFSLGFGIVLLGGEGYFVQKYIFFIIISMLVKQWVYYLEDCWQLIFDWLLMFGFCNDCFINFNSDGCVYVESGDQWVLCLGVSWDVFGDVLLKLFVNLGCYYLVLFNSVVIRGVFVLIYMCEYFVYIGIDVNGNLIGFILLGLGLVLVNGEYGQVFDLLVVVLIDLKLQYQDELILGFEKILGSCWNSGVKVIYCKLQLVIDDICDLDCFVDRFVGMGLDVDIFDLFGCVIFNLGVINIFQLWYCDGFGYILVSMSLKDWGYDGKKVKCQYVVLDLFIECLMFDGWFGCLDYIWLCSFGNIEGQVRLDIGQSDVFKI